MWVSESLLFRLAKLFYKSEAAHSNEMKQALTNREDYNRFRREQIDKILAAAEKYGMSIQDRVVLDMGCSDGAISGGYLERGAAEVIGVDIDAPAVEQAQKNFGTDKLSFHASTTTGMPLEDNRVDAIMCYDVFEHVSQPDEMLQECYRVLKPGGQMLIGTWGWRHPYAPHLWSTMPVPWAHVVFSEKTLLRTCKRVYLSPWYRPTMHDFDENGNKIPDKFNEEEISKDYLNKLLVRDFEKVFESSPFEYQLHRQHFGSKLARWTKYFLKAPIVGEFVTSYIWVVLTKPENQPTT